MKRPLFWTGAAFLSSLAVFLRLSPPIALLLALLSAFFAAILSSEKLTLRRALLFMLAALFGAAAALGYSAAKNAYLAPVISSEQADIVMICDDFDRSTGHRSITGKALITAEKITRRADITVWGYFEEPPVPGEVTAFRAKLSEPLVYSMSEALSLPENPPFKFTSFRLKMQNYLSQRIFSLSFDDDCGGILSALLTGDRSHIPSSVNSAFRKSSLSHLLAISGMHIVLISAAAQGVFRRLLGEQRANLVSVLICWAFACLAGLGVSVIRACLMITVVNLGGCFGRKADTLTSLMLSALIITLSSPEAVFSASFLLSFSAVLGLAVFAPKQSGRGGVLDMLKQSVGVSAAAQVGTLPVTAILFKTVSLVGIPANLAAVWLLQPIMLLGIAGLLAGFILPFAAEHLLIPSLLQIKLLVFIADSFAAVPYASEPFCEYWQFAWLALSVVLTVAVFCRAPKGFCRQAAIALSAAVYLTMAVFSSMLDRNSIYALTFEQSDCCAVISGDRAVLFGSAEEPYQLRAIENIFSQIGVQKLDGVIIEKPEQLNSSTVSLMKNFDCDVVYAENDRYYSQLCRLADAKLCQLPADGVFFGRVSYIPTQSGFELRFADSKILKTDGKCDIIGRYHLMPPVKGAKYIRA